MVIPLCSIYTLNNRIRLLECKGHPFIAGPARCMAGLHGSSATEDLDSTSLCRWGWVRQPRRWCMSLVAVTQFIASLWALMTTHWEEEKWALWTLPPSLNTRSANETCLHSHPALSWSLNSNPSAKGHPSLALTKRVVWLFVLLEGKFIIIIS